MTYSPAPTAESSSTAKSRPPTKRIFLDALEPITPSWVLRLWKNTGLYLDDGAVTIFLNAHGKSDDISAELKAFLDFMLGKPSGDPFIKILSEQMKIAKLNAKWRRVYMRNMLYKRELRAEARTEAHTEMLNALNELMRSNIISPEQVNAIKAAALKS